MALRDDHASFHDFMIETQQVWRSFARYLCRRWKPPYGVDEADVEQELILAGWQASTRWDPGRGTTIDAYVRFNALDKAKKWLHKQRNAKRRDGSAPSRVPTVFSALERDDDETGSAQERLAWIEPDAVDQALERRDVRRTIERLIEQLGDWLPYRERECLAHLAEAGGDAGEAADRIAADPSLCQALRLGSVAEAELLARRAITQVLEMLNETGGIEACH